MGSSTVGRVSLEDYEKVASISNPNDVTIERVDAIEAETRHDIMALTKAMAEVLQEMQVGAFIWVQHLTIL